MNTNRLRHLFSRALRTSLAAPLVLAGCGTGGTGGTDLRGYSAIKCTPHGEPAIDDLSIEPAVDSVALRMLSGPGGSYETRDSTGEACATATDVPACQTALAETNPGDGFISSCIQVCSRYFLATTRGDEVKTWATLQELQDLLGTVETAQDAALLTSAAGYRLSCGNLEEGAVKPNPDGGFNVVATRGYACGEGSSQTQYVINVSANGELREVEDHVLRKGSGECAVGRRPVGLEGTVAGDCEDALGHHFAQTAHLEAASIHAFLRLREELALHGAEATLQDAALASAVDEVMHTEMTGRLARRYGATPPPPAVAAVPLRPLNEVALDNAVEGCVRETYGALIAHHQALHARDAQVRESMARIAEDETRHAGLSWDIDRWARSRLPASELAALREAQKRAVSLLRAEVSVPLDSALVTEAGLPTPEAALTLLDTLEQELWA
ncbi:MULTISPECIES: ferritin-like domain-containing protein [unclassified Corallococcus]|uniref:ferritin-like domain-containing protein n=1 Tax=unclassified Corallococcus TaxID=2685029 RepID=UPI001A906526|nr:MULTISPECIES: ferritin-like domain-containing protein [unclassified Corallococcus]MBN9684963.1 ferritin-like domain-containing protein [Corallococcus sp. NCSPR001]WAS83575.1 ferritin-like domain-containing protein [Corallococcus sp. NCRR]